MKFDKSCFRFYEYGTVENIYSGRLCNIVTGQNCEIYAYEAIDEMKKIYNDAMKRHGYTDDQIKKLHDEIITRHHKEYTFSCITDKEIQ